MATTDPRGTPTVPRTHPAFWVSCALGALGVLLIVIGLIVGGQVIFEVGAAAGVISLIAALAWRSDLVASWRRDHPRM
ncbi:MAG TPA: hypothetical protein VLL25_00695 [Acidimicrobiales bacterium]|nr:hypothetical protein [Acidimicrobiales bacterium]